MARPEPAAGLGVEVLVEQHEVTPRGIFGVAAIVAVTRTLTARVGKKDARQARADLARHLVERAHDARADRAFDAEALAVEMMVALEGLEQEIVQRKPHRAAPIGVAAEHA